MAELTIGSLCSGYGGLTLAVLAALGGRVAWHSEIEPAADRVLTARFPGVPNIGDMTAVDWSSVETVDVLEGGTPCQDVSHAGKRAGMRTGTRSGLWSSMVDAIDVLRPKLVVWENVRGVLSSAADSGLESCPVCVGDGSGDALRALGRVLGDLADSGYDARWCGLRASDVGAPHPRFRVFVAARNTADVIGERSRAVRSIGAGDARPPRGASRPIAEDTRGESGFERGITAPGQAEGGWAWADAGGRDRAPVADADRDTVREQPIAKSGRNGAALARLPGATAADASRDGWHEGWPESARQLGGPNAAECGPSADQWGRYAAAIQRWELTLSQTAPAATEATSKGAQRLSPRFVEWMMGLPAGWVTDVPGISRNDQLKMLANGVVPQQAAAAINYLMGES